MNSGDKHKNTDLPELEALERAWQDVGDEQPPELVDLAVLNRARAAVDKPQPWFWNMSWAHGLTTVAVAAIAITLFIQMRDQESPTLPVSEMGSKGAATRLDEEAAVAGALGRAADNPAEQKIMSNEEDALRVNAPAAASAGYEALKEDKDGSVDDISVTSDFRAIPQGQDAPALELEKTVSPAVSGDRAPATKKAELSSFADESEEVRRRQSDSVTESVAAEPIRDEAQYMKQSAREKNLDLDLDPETWLEDIRALVEAGELDAARASLDEFLLAWPEFPVPDDLLP